MKINYTVAQSPAFCVLCTRLDRRQPSNGFKKGKFTKLEWSKRKIIIKKMFYFEFHRNLFSVIATITLNLTLTKVIRVAKVRTLLCLVQCVAEHQVNRNNILQWLASTSLKSNGELSWKIKRVSSKRGKVSSRREEHKILLETVHTVPGCVQFLEQVSQLGPFQKQLSFKPRPAWAKTKIKPFHSRLE